MNGNSRRRDVFLKIERIPGYSPLAPLVGSRSYGRDAMYNAGPRDRPGPAAEIAAATLDALVYREYLDPHYTIPNTAKLVRGRRQRAAVGPPGAGGRALCRARASVSTSTSSTGTRTTATASMSTG